MEGLVLRGSRNVFTVRTDEPGGVELECRIKGKVLKGVENFYNPLAPGDRVSLETGGLHTGTALITAVRERRGILTRFNQKGQKSQILAANVSLVLCVTSPVSPPFRPRFVDRLLVQAEAAGLTPLILCNKYDLAGQAEAGMEERLRDYERIGYAVLRLSAKTGQGMDELRRLMAGAVSVILGQSGVGKSTLINGLSPGLNMKTGRINEKYDRGNHTTTLSVMLELSRESAPSTFVIDTPGIRRMVPDGVSPADLIHYMKEFAPLAGRCTYGLSCSHKSEPGCGIREAVAAGTIHRDRYESFVRIGEELAAL
ncbi:MAG: ribosome small subunit-dependent GTPase A [Treponema sp.]|jgi:ribosome biogenesis GTPase|nr:ribosome small subunit-dependent GTPase A [Treponema sp.]